MKGRRQWPRKRIQKKPGTTCGREYEIGGSVDRALAAYKAIGDHDGLNATGAYAESKDSDVAIQAYEAAGNWPALVDMGDRYIRLKQQIQARKVYEIAARLYEQQLQTTA